MIKQKAWDETADPPVVLRADALLAGYGSPDRLPVLADVSLSLHAGEILALLGASGTGKSTLLRVLAGLQRPDAGTVHLHGQPLSGPDPRLGFIFQKPGLLPWLNLEENVAFGLGFKHQAPLSRRKRQESVERAIRQVGLEAARKLRPSMLSGGMAQRAALARSLARHADILLLDEPFSALDEITRGNMQQLLLRIRKENGVAAVLVTHDIDEALQVADRIVLIGGRPAHCLATWGPKRPHPRQATDPELAALRLDILKNLKNANDIEVHP